MAGLTISSDQAQSLARSWVRNYADNVHRLVDAAVAPAEDAANPYLRLKALGQVVVGRVSGVGAAGPLLTVDVGHALTQLCASLRRGARYDEAMASAMLSAAAALGAFWYADPRLLRHTALALDAVVDLFNVQMSDQFELAAQAGEAMAVNARYALRQALEQGATSDALRLIVLTTFGHTPGSALGLFLTCERTLCSVAGIHDHNLQALCIAGDLCFGLGRGVRLVQHGAPDRTPAEQANDLSRAWHGLVDDADR